MQAQATIKNLEVRLEKAMRHCVEHIDSRLGLAELLHKQGHLSDKLWRSIQNIAGLCVVVPSHHVICFLLRAGL